MTNASDESRMAAIIRCVLHLDSDNMTDEEFYRAWGQAKFYTELIHQVKWL